MLQTFSSRWDGATTRGRCPPRLVLLAWAPHEQAADTPHVDVEHVADVSVDVVEVLRLLDKSGAAEDPFELDVLDFRVGFPDDSSTQL